MWSRVASLIVLLLAHFFGIAQRQPNLTTLLDLIEQSKQKSESLPDSGLVLARQAKQMADEMGMDSITGPINIALATSYSYLANYEKSIEHSFEAMRIARAYSDTTTLIDAYNNLGIDFMFREEYETSGDYFLRVQDLAIATGDSLRWGHALNNLGLLQGYGGIPEVELSYYEQAQEVFDRINEREGYANTLLNIGTVYTVLRDFGKANVYYDRALGVFRDLGYESAIEQTLLSKAENNLEADRIPEAIDLSKQALEIAVANGLWQDVVYAYELIRQAYVKSGQYRQAHEYLMLHTQLKDSLFNLQKSEQISALQVQYESEQKEQQIRLLTIENDLKALRLDQETRERWMILVFATLIILLGSYAFLVSLKRARLKNQLLSRETDNLRLRIRGIVEGSTDEMGVTMESINGSIDEPLSEREFEILSLALTDLSNTEISEKTFVSVNTVKYHLKNIYEKLGVSNRKEAMQFALRSTKA